MRLNKCIKTFLKYKPKYRKIYLLFTPLRVIYVVRKNKEVNIMTINLNLNDKDRKYLVELLSQITESPAKYLGVPSCAYQVSNFIVGRYGELTFDENLVNF